MAYTTINKSSDYFNTKLYTGDASSSRNITGVNFKPDFVWVKGRTENSRSHILTDIVRGASKQISSDSSSAETSYTNQVTGFVSDGFTTSSGTFVNGNSENYVSWNWLAGGSQGSSNTDGSINTTYTSVNTTAGFSISSYTGTGSNATVGHGLGAAPKMILIKVLNEGSSWGVYHDGVGNFKYLRLNSTNEETASSSYWNSTSPTSSVFSLGSEGNVNQSAKNFIAYCFAEKTGYSKFGSYTGNGNADGTFVYTGFKPAWIMYKKFSGAGRWTMEDNKRDPFNVATHGLAANASSAENTGSNYWDVDLLSNGFKFRTTEQETNQSGQDFIYMAFAEAPLVGTNNVPCTAR